MSRDAESIVIVGGAILAVVVATIVFGATGGRVAGVIAAGAAGLYFISRGKA